MSIISENENKNVLADLTRDELQELTQEYIFDLLDLTDEAGIDSSKVMAIVRNIANHASMMGRKHMIEGMRDD